MNKPTAALMKRKPETKPVTHSKSEIEERLRKTFIEFLENEGLSESDIGEENFEKVLKVMRSANKLGYTNGFIKSK